jgi:hypothetical protein
MADQHFCHWPGCRRVVQPSKWGCSTHWFTLPKTLRDKLWKAYRRGQEITKTPSPEYVQVAKEIQAWIKERSELSN